MFYQVISYLKFWVYSKKKHGIHSPFVYDLGEHCFYHKRDPQFNIKIETFRKTYLRDNTTIEVKDFGAGSKNLAYNSRKISDIAKNAGITLKHANLLTNLINYCGVKKILEIGTSLGIGTAAMALANSNVHISTLEGCPNTAELAQENFTLHGLKQIDLKIGEFSKTLPVELKNQQFDLIYFDGNHQEKPTLDYFELCLSHAHNKSIFIFDDIYWSKGMTQAWKQIIRHPDVTVSIDTFRWGIIFFRKEQAKEHFVIRI